MRSVNISRFVVLSFSGIALLAAACGGGNGDEPAASAPRLTDPAAAPVIERAEDEEPLTYTIRNDEVAAPSGVTTLVTPGSASEDDSGDGGSGGSSGATYTIEAGDSCNGIASTLGVELDALMAANPSINDACSNLQLGGELVVPDGVSTDEDGGGDGDGSTEDEPAAESAGAGEYAIQSGDNCLSIAAAHDVDVDELIALNGLDCEALQIDQVIQIP